MIERKVIDSILYAPALFRKNISRNEHGFIRDINYQEIIGPKGYFTPPDVVNELCKAASHQGVHFLRENPLYQSEEAFFYSNQDEFNSREEVMIQRIASIAPMTFEELLVDMESRGFGMSYGVDMREFILSFIPPQMFFSMQPMYYYHQNILGVVQRHLTPQKKETPYRALIAAI